ncbi:MAG: hypothetical protein OXI77_02170 [Chloroflexota bacterium]|nr:hypothetical protein [Chloroflexota bacterium]MDE2907793.1 hypothetical protein [Chloroflexota bacterium]
MAAEARIKNYSTRARHLFVICGIAVLLWSSMEDDDARMVTLLGMLLAAALSMMLVSSQRFPERLKRLSLAKRAAMSGALIGALASLTTPLLMLFKDLRHAHVFPDYPAGMMLATLERMPAWALAGGLAGFGIGLLLKLGPDWRITKEW